MRHVHDIVAKPASSRKNHLAHLHINLKMENKPKAQPSRKGKRAWRKNIDVNDIQAGLEAKREQEVLLGEDSENSGFIIDNEGDSASTTSGFVLKTSEILANKSKIPAIQSKKVKHKVSKAQTKKLMALAGRLATESKLKTKLDRDGLIRASSLDVWGDKEEVELPDAYKVTPFVSYTSAKVVPKTLSHEPLVLHADTPQEKIVHPGKSYNPDLDSWKDLIDREFGLENKLDLKRQEMEEHQKRIQYLIETLDDKEFEESDDETESKDKEEENDGDEDNYKLSLNEKTEWKIKTKTRRNKEAKHKQRLELEAKLKDLKKQIHDLKNLEVIEQDVEQKLQSIKPRPAKKYHRHGKHEVGFKPIEVKLSDELTGSLRTMKPEGNLLYDLMHKLQMQGKIEARYPQRKKKRSVKLTEKWSYKDFK